MKLLAVQFDNGTERNAIDRIMERVHKENFILNWIYGMLTGVSDPASGWEQDRLKLRKYAAQSLVINVEDIDSSSFSVEEKDQARLNQNGYETTQSYLKARYSNKNENKYINQELMYTTFSSLGDLLAYCCYRGDYNWFEIVNNLIVESKLPNRTALMRQSLELRQLYFNSPNCIDPKPLFKAPVSGLFHKTAQNAALEPENNNPIILIALYPIFLQISSDFLKDSKDKKFLEQARHALTLQHPFQCLDHFVKIKGEMNIVLHIAINLITELRDNPSEDLYLVLKEFEALLCADNFLLKKEYFGKWDLSFAQSMRVLNLLNRKNDEGISKLLFCLRKGYEPMKTFVSADSDEEYDIDTLETPLSFP